jgi:SAM-dependent methyltransferase
LDPVTKLHLGCFDSLLDGWYNTDITPHLFLARVPVLRTLFAATGFLKEARVRQHRAGLFRRVYYLNVLKRFPFADNTLHAVYSSHMLYNLPPEGALFCAKEVYRVLCPGGVFRLALIDLDALVRSYDAQHPEHFLEAVYQPTIKGEKNHMQWSYNAISLKRLLNAAGFDDVQHVAYHQGRCPDVEWIDYRPDSLFMEGVK